MRALFERKGKRWAAMINERSADLQARLFEEEPVLAFAALLGGARELIAPRKLSRCEAAIGVNLLGIENEITFVALDKVPCVRSELMLNGIDQAR